MSLFRSDTMQHGTLILPADRARHFMEILGRQSCIQFTNANHLNSKQQYRVYVQRIEKMERILRYLMDQIQKLPGAKIIRSNVKKFVDSDYGYKLEIVEQALNTLYEQFQRFEKNNKFLAEQNQYAMEEKAIIFTATKSMAFKTLLRTIDTDIGFKVIAGVIKTDFQNKFARAIFRASRGNAFTHFEYVGDLYNFYAPNEITLSDVTPRSVFVIYFQSVSKDSNLSKKLQQICEAFELRTYDWPYSIEDAKIRLNQIDQLIHDKSKALIACEEFLSAESIALLECHSQSEGSLIDDYFLFCIKEKAIYATLNLFEGKESTLRADCWIPAGKEEFIRRLLAQETNPHQVSACLLTDHYYDGTDPPTLIRTTDFTQGFQAIVNTYGIPRYKEINPGIFTIIFYPFLFGIMFGDIGHALCLFILSIYILYTSDKVKDSKSDVAYIISKSRYVLLLMSLFALYSGFMYNEYFGLGLDLFKTRYIVSHMDSQHIYYMKNASKSIYPFGFDPIWKGAINEITFFNSFKMKFSVIIAFMQMLLGTFLKGFNCIFFHDFVTLIFEVLPQILFTLSFSGFITLIIFIKWSTPEFLIDGASNKPYIINNIIEMAFNQKPTIIAFSGQKTLHKVCLCTMALMIPFLLIPKPLILKYKAHRRRRYQYIDVESQPPMDYHNNFDLAEAFVYQGIETIEFTLSIISNTASYLRLWALSLAHQQLCVVFFSMLISTILAINTSVIKTGFFLFFGMFIYLFITFGLFIFMDTLECCLHALRLQWVEFQNKFFKADGYEFEPFSLQKCMENSLY